MTKAEFERNKLTQKVRDLEAQLSLSKQDTADLATNYKQLVAEKNALMQQLAQFEKDSFEIQAKVRRGINLTKESEKVERNVSEMRDRERELIRQLEQLQVQMELKQSEQERLTSKATSAQAYAKSLEQDLEQARDEIRQLTGQINQGANENIKTVGKVNKQDVQIIELRDQLNSSKQSIQQLQN